MLQTNGETFSIASGDCCGDGEKAIQLLKNEINKLEKLFEEKTEPVRKVLNNIHEWYTPAHKEALEELGIDIFENLPQIDKYFKNWGPGVPVFPPPGKDSFRPPSDNISQLAPK